MIMDALATVQAKIIDTTGTHSKVSIEAVLPAGKAQKATVTQVSPDPAAPNTHKIKLEVNNTSIQISAKFPEKPPEQGSSITLQRSTAGKIQISLSNAPKVDSSPSNSATPIAKPLVSQSSNGNTVLRAPVVINASGSALAQIERALPSGKSVPAQVIPPTTAQSHNSSVTNTITQPSNNNSTLNQHPQSSVNQPSNGLLNATPSVNQPSQLAQSPPTQSSLPQPISPRAIQDQSAGKLANAAYSRPLPLIPAATQPPVTTTVQTAANPATSNTGIAGSPVASNSGATAGATASSNINASAPLLTNSAPANNPASTTPATSTANAQSVTTPATLNLNTPSQLTATNAPLANIATTVAGAIQYPSPLPAASPAASASHSATGQNTPIAAHNNAALPQPVSSALPTTAVTANNPQTAAATLPASTPTSHNAATLAQNNSALPQTAPITSPTVAATGNITQTSIQNNSAQPSTTAMPTVAAAVNNAHTPIQNNSLLAQQAATTTPARPITANNLQPAAISTAANAPQTSPPPAATAVVQNPQAGNSGAKTTATQASSPPTPTPTPALAPANQALANAPLPNAPGSPNSSQTPNTLPSASAPSNTAAPTNLQLQGITPKTAAIKVAVAGQIISLQAPANLPPLQNLQITRSEGLQANISWQQPSQVNTALATNFSLSPRQVLLVDQSLKQALPQQIPIAEGINQLVAQTQQIANNAASQVPVDKIALTIMKLFGVKPGTSSASDNIKRNVQQGGMFSESKILNQPSSTQGDMKNFLAKLNHLAEQLPSEQKELLQSTSERMLARITSNQLTHVQQQHAKADISNERSFQIDIPVQHNEKLENVEMEIKQRKHQNSDGEQISVWSVKLHFDLEERGEVDAEVALNPSDSTISTTFLCSHLATVQALNRKMDGFREQLSQQGFDIQTLHCTQGSQVAAANNHVSKRIIDIRT